MDSFNSPYVRLIPIWYQDEDGNTVELRTDYVTLKRLTENHSLVKWELVQVWILHPKRHRRATWKIGIDVSREEFERFVDPDTNSLFALTTFENGKPYEQLLPKSQWMKAKAAFDQQNPSNSDGFDDPADSSNLTFGMWARQLPPGGKIRVRVPRQEDD